VPTRLLLLLLLTASAATARPNVTGRDDPGATFDSTVLDCVAP
jgi:hypothetical protein